jgi:RNA polymerase sigma-70 factor (ECF subfamily)
VSNTSGDRRAHTDQAPPLPVALDFDTFVVRNEQALYLYLCRVLASDEAARDIAQEALFRAWTHFETIRTYDRPDAWLFRIATNLALSSLRRREAHTFSQLLRHGGEHASPERDTQNLLTDPDDVELRAAERDVIDRVLRALPGRQRTALLLRALVGLPVEEIAQALDVSLANTYQLLSRGAKRFRALYEAAQRDGSTKEQETTIHTT